MELPFLLKKINKEVTSYAYNGSDKLEIYIPSVNFERSNGIRQITSRHGKNISTVGIFYFTEGKEVYFFSLPVHIEFEYSLDRTEKGYKLNDKIPANNYHVFTLKKGDLFIVNDIYIQNAKDSNGILNMFYQAYIPNNIGYDEIFSILSNAFYATDMKFPSVSVLLEGILSQLYRSKTNIYKPFRMFYNGKNKYAYKNINIKKVPEISSLFSSLVGEDGYYQLTQIITNKDNKELIRKNAIETIIDIQTEKE